jgi:hypothetical protein
VGSLRAFRGRAGHVCVVPASQMKVCDVVGLNATRVLKCICIVGHNVERSAALLLAHQILYHDEITCVLKKYLTVALY